MLMWKELQEMLLSTSHCKLWGAAGSKPHEHKQHPRNNLSGIRTKTVRHLVGTGVCRSQKEKKISKYVENKQLLNFGQRCDFSPRTTWYSLSNTQAAGLFMKTNREKHHTGYLASLIK